MALAGALLEADSITTKTPIHCAGAPPQRSERLHGSIFSAIMAGRPGPLRPPAASRLDPWSSRWIIHRIAGERAVPLALRGDDSEIAQIHYGRFNLIHQIVLMRQIGFVGPACVEHKDLVLRRSSGSIRVGPIAGRIASRKAKKESGAALRKIDAIDCAAVLANDRVSDP